MSACETNEVKIFKALSDENRLKILELLKDGAKCGCVLLEELNILQPTLSHHMKILVDVNLVDACKDGKWVYYSLNFDGSKNARDLINKYTLCECEYENYPKCDKIIK